MRSPSDGTDGRTDGRRGERDVALNTLGTSLGGGKSGMIRKPTDRRRRLLGRLNDVNDGRSWIFLFFFVTTLVHSYCFCLHISDKRGALRTVLCEKRGKRKKKRGEENKKRGKDKLQVIHVFLLS